MCIKLGCFPGSLLDSAWVVLGIGDERSTASALTVNQDLVAVAKHEVWQTIRTKLPGSSQPTKVGEAKAANILDSFPSQPSRVFIDGHVPC